MKYFIPMLTVLFIGLKLTGQIEWTWTWVLSPLWLGFILTFVVIFITCLFQRKYLG